VHGGRLTAVTLETVTFDRPHRIAFRLVRGPVPHVAEEFALTEHGGVTRLGYSGGLGTDFGAAGRWWADRVTAAWEAAVRSSLAGIRTEAERRARPGTADPWCPGPPAPSCRAGGGDNRSPVPRLGQQQLRRKQMTDTREQISQLLREASETHHRVFRIVGGADDDWASWYAWWLINLSELPALLESTPVRSELIYLLVNLDKQYTAEQPGEPWESYYADRILGHFRAAHA